MIRPLTQCLTPLLLILGPCAYRLGLDEIRLSRQSNRPLPALAFRFDVVKGCEAIATRTFVGDIRGALPLMHDLLVGNGDLLDFDPVTLQRPSSCKTQGEARKVRSRPHFGWGCGVLKAMVRTPDTRVAIFPACPISLQLLVLMMEALIRILEHQPQQQLQLEYLQETVATLSRQALEPAAIAVQRSQDGEDGEDGKGGQVGSAHKERFLANRLAMR